MARKGLEFFRFDGKDSRDYGIYLTEQIQVDGATPDIETVSVPGRNGALLIDNGGWSNVSLSLSCFVKDEKGRSAQAALTEISKWLTGGKSYRRLELPQEDGYRMAYLTAAPQMAIKGRGARSFSISLSCKPQVWTFGGEQEVTITEAAVLYNDGLTALPLITVYGSGKGTVTVGDTIVTISDIDGYVTLDSEIQDAYKGTANKNSTIQTEEFPTLEQGTNSISFSGGVTKLTVRPRWWHL